jgi:Ca2+-dependent lipid-binding protein
VHVNVHTQVQHNTLDPDWATNNKVNFRFPMRQVEQGGGGDMEIKIMDWDKLSAPDEVGRVIVPSESLKHLVRQQFHQEEGPKAQAGARTTKQKKRRRGSGNDDVRAGDTRGVEMHEVERLDKSAELSADESRKSAEDLLLEELEKEDTRRSGGGVLEVVVNFARHLPRMDTFGKCDAFVELRWREFQFKTSVQKSSFSPDFNQTFLFPYEFPAASLDITVLRAKDLLAADRGGTSDPYVCLYVGAAVKEAQKTMVKRKTLSPEWNETFHFKLGSCGRRENLTLECFDYDFLGSDDSLGKVRIALAQLVDDQEYTQWCSLGEDATNMGQLQVRYKVSPLADGDGRLDELERSELEVKLYDWDMVGDNDEVGTATVPAGMLILASRHKLKPVELSPAGQSSTQLPLKDTRGKAVIGNDKIPALIDLTIRLRDPLPPPLEGVVRVSVVQARNLKAMDRGGTSDPYAIVTLSSAPKNTNARTQIVVKSVHPYWNASFDLSSPNLHSEKMQVAIYDKDLLSDDQIGTVQLDLSRFMLNPLPKEDTMQVGSAETQWYAIQDNSERHRITGEVELKVGLERKPPPSSMRSWIVLAAVKEARGLTAKDSSGTSDPYALLVLGKQKHKTKVVYKELNPRWDETFQMVVNTAGLRPSHPLLLSVFDKDMIGADDLIGQATIDLERILTSLVGGDMSGSDGQLTSLQEWLPLYEDAARTKSGGEVLVEISATQVFAQNDASKHACCAVSLLALWASAFLCKALCDDTVCWW